MFGVRFGTSRGKCSTFDDERPEKTKSAGERGKPTTLNRAGAAAHREFLSAKGACEARRFNPVRPAASWEGSPTDFHPDQHKAYVRPSLPPKVDQTSVSERIEYGIEPEQRRSEQ